MSKTIWSDAEAQLRPIMSNGLIDLPSNSKFSVKDLNYNFDKIINVNNAINNLNEINEHIANTHIHMSIDDIPQSDWNQTNDTAKDYIKNKTHGSELKEVTLFNNSLDFEVVSDETGSFSQVSSRCDFLIENNKKYTIIFDETEYICTSFEFQGIIALGNLSIIEAVDDTGEPFLLGTYPIDGLDFNNLGIYSNSVETTHNIVIKTFNETIYKLDTKYLQIDDSLSNTSVNPVENKVVNEAISETTKVINESISEITPDIYAGKSWTQSNITNGNFHCIYCVNDMWVAGEYFYNKGLYYSDDGIIWTQSNITDVGFYDIYHDNYRTWVAAGKSGLYYSTDGMYWRESDITEGHFKTVYWDNGIWVAGGKGLYYSNDGKTWTQSNIINDYFIKVYYSNGVWVACSSDNKGLYYSNDGMTWTQSNMTNGYFDCVYYNDGMWAAGGHNDNDKIIYYSTDAITWISATFEKIHTNA